MKINGKHTRSIWLEADGQSVGIIDQTLLPHRFATLQLKSWQDAAHAIKSMQTRGAPLIGAVAAYGLAMALRDDASDENLERAYTALQATRPTAINLKWALDEIMAAVRNRPREERVAAAYTRAAEICDEDAAMSEARLHVSDSQGRRVVVLDRPQFLIGRRTAADLQIVSTDVSREHAEIVQDEGRYLLRDRGSRYGTFVNGEQIVERPLTHGDKIRLGRTDAVEMVFLLDATTEMHVDDLARLAAWIGDNKVGRGPKFAAMVAADDLIFGMGRAFDALFADYEWVVKAFRTEEQANAWLREV